MFRMLGAQESMYLFEKLNPGTSTYHHTAASEITGQLNEPLFKQALNLLAARHEALRAHVTNGSDNKSYLEPRPIEQLAPSTTWPLIVISADTKEAPPLEKLSETLTSLNANHIINEPFDFNNGPLWRSALVKYPDGKQQFLFVFHHMIIDVESQNIIMRDLSAIYNALIRQEPMPHTETYQLASILASDTQQPDDDKLEYWKNKLANLNSLRLHTDFNAENAFQFRGDRVNFELSANLMQHLQAIANKNHATVNQVLLAAVYVLLYRISYETDICLGVASGNRIGHQYDVNNVVNCFVNSVPLRLTVNKDKSFTKFLNLVSKRLKNSLQNQLPLDTLIQKALSKTAKSSNNITSPFNVLCNFNKAKASLNLSGTESSYPIELNLGHSKFENFGINFDMLPDGTCRAFLEFNRDLYKTETMENLVAHLQHLVAQIAKHPTCKITDLPLLTDEDKKHLDAFHQSHIGITPDDFVQDLFTRVAKHKKKAKAVIFHREDGQTETITYSTLDKKSTQLATYLINLGVSPEKPVGVCLTRSMNLIIAILAIMKAGGVVVPLESSIDKLTGNMLLQHKITDTLLDTVIVDTETNKLFSATNTTIYPLNIEQMDVIRRVNRQLNNKYQKPTLRPDNLAYIMYTSGTTGTPKGVMITHAGLINLAYAIKDRNLQPGSKILCTAPPTFDCFFFELLEWLATEGELHLIYEKGRLAPDVQAQVISQFGINCATLLPEVIKNLDPAQLPSLKDIISMGATAHEETLKLWYNHGRTIRNEYGPTEATICATEHPYHPDESYSNIGRPIKNTTMYILDPDKHECPIGVPGEIHIAGASLARGYVAKPDLSSEKFPTMLYDKNTLSFKPLAADTIHKEEDVETKTNAATKNNKKRKQDKSSQAANDDEPNTLELPKKKQKREHYPKTLADLVTPTKTKGKKRKHSPESSLKPATEAHFEPVAKKQKREDTEASAACIRLYSTGDYGRTVMGSDGTTLSIDFLGRKDRQIKIHGNRIEIDGVEALLAQYPHIKAVYVQPNPTKDALIAYIVPKIEGRTIPKADIDEFLKQSGLSLIARPKTIIQLHKLPITKNGKVDTSALPTPPVQFTLPMHPQNATQRQLCDIWADVLNINPDDIDMNKSFRELGGDSITLAKLQIETNQRLPLTQPVGIGILRQDISIKDLGALIQPLLNQTQQTENAQLASAVSAATPLAIHSPIPVKAATHRSLAFFKSETLAQSVPMTEINSNTPNSNKIP